MFIKQAGVIEKASKLKEGEIEFVVSTGTLDAHGERINVDGINLKDFKQNPVILWGHDGFNLPIATATKVWKEAGKLMARAKFILEDEFAAKVYDYLVKGYLKAVSIGGMVEEWGADGITISKLLMKEFSVVTIGANPDALAVNKTLSGKEMNELNILANAYARKMLSKEDGEKDLKESVETLTKLVTTLREITNGETQQAKVSDTITQRRVILSQAQAVDKQAESVIKLIKLKGDNK